MVQVSVVSGTYNRLKSLREFVASVRTAVGKLTYEIILVDGGSKDGTLDWIKKQADIRLIEHGALYGAIKAFGDGARAAVGRYVVFGNDDLVFLDKAIEYAYAIMEQDPEAGIGCFYTDRAGKDFHVAEMPAHFADGTMINVPYNGVIITPRWMGDRLNWWDLPGARTYGGDNAMCGRCWEAGYKVVTLHGCRIHEDLPMDELKEINDPPSADDHPDTIAYLSVYPRGPLLATERAFQAPDGFYPLRILYAPIYEPGNAVQHAQKYGLRRALQRKGIVREVDYATLGAAEILAAAKEWKPDVILTQFHTGEDCPASISEAVRAAVPKAAMVNWNGDVYDRVPNAKFGPSYLRTLKPFDLQTVVNQSAVPNYEAAGIKAMYWQLGYEPEGVGWDPPAGYAHYDITFQGNGYSNRRHEFGRVLLELSATHNVAVFGQYWPMLKPFGETLYDFRVGCSIYRNSKIALGDSQWAHEAYGFVSNRMFQAMAAGGCLMLHQYFDGCEDLLGYKDGVHYVGWTDYADMCQKIEYYLAHENERAEIARNGQLFTLRHHSFERRVVQLWQKLQELNLLHG